MRTLFGVLISFFVLSSCGSSDRRSEPNDSVSNENPAVQPRNETVDSKKISESMSEAKPNVDFLKEAIQSDKSDRILTAARGALGRDTKNLSALNAIAVVFVRQGKFKAAQSMFNRALAVNGRSWEILNNLGVLHLKLGERKKALGYFKRAFELNSRDGILSHNLATLYIEAGDVKKAAFALDDQMDHATDWKSYNNVAIVTSYGKSPESALRLYNEASKRSESNKEVLYNIAILYLEHLKKPNESLEVISKLKFLGLSGELRNKVNLLENRAKMMVSK